MKKKELIKRLEEIFNELQYQYWEIDFNNGEFLLNRVNNGKSLLQKLINDTREETITEANDLFSGNTKIFDTAELNLMADKIIKRFGNIKKFEEFYPKAFEYADGYISESAFADEYGVDEEDVIKNYYDYIDAFVDTIYDSISK